MGKKRATKKIRVVFDTNIWVSLALKKGLAESYKPILEDKKRISIYMSGQMLSELGRVLTYPRIAQILEKSNVDPRSALASIVKRVSLRTVIEGTIDEIKSDESDNRVLECALDSQASYVVSGDLHLSDLKEFQGIKIVTASRFLDIASKLG